jgi:hypothetical protein
MFTCSGGSCQRGVAGCAGVNASGYTIIPPRESADAALCSQPVDSRREGGFFTAIKVDARTNLPLAGATFTLCLDGQELTHVISTENGALTFDRLSAGTYALSETMPAPGYHPHGGVFTVLVCEDGEVTINGSPANGYRIVNVPVSEPDPGDEPQGSPL